MSLYLELGKLRKLDRYPDEEIGINLISTFFPKNIEDLVTDLSNVTSAFYGLLLQGVGRLFGMEHINRLSEQLFYDLGLLKTEQAVLKMTDFPSDTRAFAIIALSAIYNASPEFNFSIENYSEKYTKMTISGVDRYYRICSQLGIDEYVKWPTLTPFMQAIKDNLKLDVDIEIDIVPFTERFETKCTYEFIKRK